MRSVIEYLIRSALRVPVATPFPETPDIAIVGGGQFLGQVGLGQGQAAQRLLDVGWIEQFEQRVVVTHKGAKQLAGRGVFIQALAHRKVQVHYRQPTAHLLQLLVAVRYRQ